MSRRKVLFGYLIAEGEFRVNSTEAPTVCRAFDLYLDGLSYADIAATFNREEISYSKTAPRWDKHTVKRLLGNPQYTGTGDYPQIIDIEKYQSAQDLVSRKTENRKPKKDQLKPLLKYLCCEHCGKPLVRTGGRGELVYLKCRNCEISIKQPRKAITDQVIQQWNTHTQSKEIDFCTSEELIKINNALNRALEKPTHPADVISLVIQGISERYRCCQEVSVSEPIHKLTEVDWKQFRQIVSHVSISQDGNITIHFI